MTELFVRQSIEINAPASKVWDVLTKPEFTHHWINNFGGINGAIESDWQLGSPVLWKMADGDVIVEGNVTAVKPEKLLRLTVFDTSSERAPVSENDGITYTLTTQDDKTLLSLTQGDFGKNPNGEQYYQASIAVWQKVLPVIKGLAET